MSDLGKGTCSTCEPKSCGQRSRVGLGLVLDPGSWGRMTEITSKTPEAFAAGKPGDGRMSLRNWRGSHWGQQGQKSHWQKGAACEQEGLPGKRVSGMQPTLDCSRKATSLGDPRLEIAKTKRN